MTPKPSLDSSCVLALDFEESSGSTAYDISGKNNHGTIYGATRTYGKIGRGIYFDGAGDYVVIPDSSTLEEPTITDKLTLSAWIYPMGIEARGVIVEKEGLFKMHLLHNYVQFLTGENWGGTIVTTSLHVFPNNWYHIVAVYDGTIKKVYINAVQDANVFYTTGSIGSNNYPVAVGVLYTIGPMRDYYTGIIDDVRIHNPALTDREILELYEYGRGLLRQRVRPMYARR